MPSHYIIFVLPFNKSNNEEGHNSDFKNSPKPEVKDDLDLNLNKEILLFKNNNLDLNSKLKEGTSFINIKEYLIEITFIEPLKLPLIKIPVLLFNCPPLSKSYTYYNLRTRI